MRIDLQAEVSLMRMLFKLMTSINFGDLFVLYFADFLLLSCSPAFQLLAGNYVNDLTPELAPKVRPKKVRPHLFRSNQGLPLKISLSASRQSSGPHLVHTSIREPFLASTELSIDVSPPSLILFFFRLATCQFHFFQHVIIGTLIYVF